MIQLFTDGAYSSRRDKAGSAYAFFSDGCIVNTFSTCICGVSNNFAELAAVILAFNSIKAPIGDLILYSDSMYVLGCGFEGWRRGKNKDLWTIFDREWNRIQPFISSFKHVHVDGHQTGDSFEVNGNNLVDRLAVHAYE